MQHGSQVLAETEASGHRHVASRVFGDADLSFSLVLILRVIIAITRAGI